MSTYLTTIVDHKRRELDDLQAFKIPDSVNYKNTRISFADRISNQETLGVIAEFKRSSPSKGIIHANADPVEVVNQYVAGGADGLSVLTDNKYFNGSFEDLQIVSRNVELPILCKDFILEETQIDRALLSGASIVLLIVRILPPEKLRALYEYAIHLHMEVLLEVHDETDLEIALAIQPKLIGINNRNLQSFKTDLSVTETLVKLIEDPSIVVVSESGIKSIEDCIRVAHAGVDAILIGEAVMKHQNPTQFINEIKQVERRSVR